MYVRSLRAAIVLQRSFFCFVFDPFGGKEQNHPNDKILSPPKAGLQILPQKGQFTTRSNKWVLALKVGKHLYFRKALFSRESKNICIFGRLFSSLPLDRHLSENILCSVLPPPCERTQPSVTYKKRNARCTHSYQVHTHRTCKIPAPATAVIAE